MCHYQAAWHEQKTMSDPNYLFNDLFIYYIIILWILQNICVPEDYWQQGEMQGSSTEGLPSVYWQGKSNDKVSIYLSIYL